MSKFDINKYNKYKKDLEDINKKLINYENIDRPLPSDPSIRNKRIEEYKTELVEAFNNYITYIKQYIKTFDTAKQYEYARTIGNLKLRVLRALKAIGLSLDLPTDLNKIDIETIGNINTVFNESANTEILVRSEDLSRNTTLLTDADGAVGGENLNTDTQNVGDDTNDTQLHGTANPQETQAQINDFRFPQDIVNERNTANDNIPNNNNNDNIPTQERNTQQQIVNTNPVNNKNIQVTENDIYLDTVRNLFHSVESFNNRDPFEVHNNIFVPEHNDQRVPNRHNLGRERTRNRANMSDNEENNDGDGLRELNIASRTITTTYNGEVKSLSRFIAAIKLADKLIRDKDLLINYILTKLEDKAQEVVPIEPESVQAIIDALKAGIKPKPSEELEADILALKLDKMNIRTFTKRGEEIANDYKRALIYEGFSEAKAKEQSIKKVKEMCRKQTPISYVKSVIQSTNYSTPGEVMSALVVELNNAKQDKRDIQDKDNKNNKKSNNYRGNSRGNRGNYRGGHGSNNGQNNNNNDNSNGNGHYQKNFRGGYRGRGRGGHGGNGRGGSNYGGGNYGGENHVRYFSGNRQSPSNDGQYQHQMHQMHQMQQQQQQQPQQIQHFQ
ncbi:basic-leucine zipper transcription factor A-like [Contarinia nasturtii]|uniref:basic-leucine zipper transcription factor A-like n=1 Tax=Contarinia nasturtii TaxID=265458 RepID=UPI0012D44D0A|nr:basic-leucine zipper transcription factor A-like [Contarinia nasturtii]